MTTTLEWLVVGVFLVVMAVILVWLTVTPQKRLRARKRKR